MNLMMVRHRLYGRARNPAWRERSGAVRALVILTAIVMTISAHVGSPDVWFEGKAGAYAVTVNVQVPGVVPGIADVYVRASDPRVATVSAFCNRFDAMGGIPPADAATPVAGDPGLYHVQLWMMTPGSNSVTVLVSGAAGNGKVVVPVVAAANRRLGFDRWLGIGLSAVGLFLFFGIISIVGAAVRESGVTPGDAPDSTRRRHARLAMGMTGSLTVLLLFGGWKWWNAEDARFVRTLYTTTASVASLREIGGAPILQLTITEPGWVHRNDSLWTTRRMVSRFSPLVTDHAKLMHLFLIRDGDLGAIAHLHPTTIDTVTFSTLIPILPPGRYHVLADVVRESGYAETLVSSVTIPTTLATASTSSAVSVPASVTTDTAMPVSSGSVALVRDPDDSWLIGHASGDVITLADGSTMRWLRGTGSVVQGRPAPLRFVLTGRGGGPAQLEPYMGMAAHAAVFRTDGAVFVHLHPSGTVSMAAREVFAVRQRTDTLPGMVAKRLNSEKMPGGMPGMDMGMTMPSAILGDTISFPYAFPKPGQYRIWVQVKRAGRILTGAFDAHVAN